LQENRVDPQALYRLYSQHSVTAVRTLDDFQKYLKIPNSRLYTAWSANGRLEGYAVEGKGADLQGYIHEWGGTVEALLVILSHIRNTHSSPITFITPAHSQGIIRELKQLGIRSVDGYLGLVKITNFENLCAKIKKNIRLEWGIDQFILEKKDNYFYYGFEKDLFKTDSEADMVKLLFGPHKPSTLAQHGPHLNETLDRALEIVNAHLSKKLQDLNLSSNQIRILELLTQGKSNKEIAGVINISEQGVKYHIGNLFRRFSATCRNDLKSIVRKLHTNPVDGPPPLR
jgi:DNA-binding CsgD family transcriptional regulator